MVPALKLAFSLMDYPSQVRTLRAEPLPDDVSVLLRIAAGEQDITQEAMRASGRSLEVVREAAGFFIEQILLFQEADSYRVLGAKADADAAELRRNMALLLRWLHPDHGLQSQRSIFATRVTRAWNDLKTSDRRVAYDRRIQRTLLDKSLQFKKGVPAKQQSRSRRRPNAHRSLSVRSHQPSRGRAQPTGLLRWLMMIFGGTVS